MIEGVSPDLPYTDRLPAPKVWGLRLGRPLVRLRPAAFLASHGAWCPTRAAVGAGDPGRQPSRAAGRAGAVHADPRLTFAMAKRELFAGAVGRFLAQVGQISLNRHEVDPQAIRRAVQVLRAGKVLAVFPEGRTRWR